MPSPRTTATGSPARSTPRSPARSPARSSARSASAAPTTHVFSCTAPLAQSAWQVAADLLREDATRWMHTCAVAARAGEAAGILPPHQRALLVAAAWLHDIGYAPTVVHTMQTTAVGASRFHPLDGARYLTVHGWPAEVAALVAHHSGAVHLAAVLGLAEQVQAYTVTPELEAVADALTWADQTTGPAGQPWTLPQRVAEALHRRGPDSPHVLSHSQRGPTLAGAVERTEQRRRCLT